eukprot:7363443-Pyramimonas_sp.AAC.1
MYTPGSRIHQDPLSCASFSAGPENASVYRVRLLSLGLEGARCSSGPSLTVPPTLLVNEGGFG